MQDNMNKKRKIKRSSILTLRRASKCGILGQKSIGLWEKFISRSGLLKTTVMGNLNNVQCNDLHKMILLRLD